jgi:hypothetical protein
MTGDYEVCSPQVRAPSVIGSPPMYTRRLGLRLGGSRQLSSMQPLD